MIDFTNASFAKLSQVNPDTFLPMISSLLMQNEQVITAYKGIRDGVVFTSLRIIAINVQGITGKKKDFTSLPYSKIQAFSVETAGVLDLDAELEIWFTGLGKVRFEFTGSTDISHIGQFIGARIF